MKRLFAFLGVLLLLVASKVGTQAADIAVVMSSDAFSYREALEGFREAVQHRIVGIQTLKDNPATWPDEMKKLRSFTEPDVIFVIGTTALQAVSSEIANIPIVHAMVFNPHGIATSDGRNIVGIGMSPSAGQVISILKEMNPRFRRVGTMINPSRIGSSLQPVRLAFDKAGIQLTAKEIRSAADVGATLKSFNREVDILWLWPDEAFLSDDLLQRIFLFSFDNKIPVLGLSDRHTEMGALVSLSFGSARDMGRQAGEAVSRMLANTNTAFLPLVAPRQTKITVNLKTARILGVELPHTMIQRADNGIRAPVYEEGDWWVFRTRTTFTSGGSTKEENHRVVFKNGKFESIDPAFLTGGDTAGSPSLLPFPSVYFAEPTRQWLDFPLLPGKIWNFTYRRRTYASGRTHWVNAKAEVTGTSNKPIDTVAGKFDAIEISRVDPLIGMRAHLKYFYSPQTKSVVKSHAKILSTQRPYEFELELVGYGSAREATIHR